MDTGVKMVALMFSMLIIFVSNVSALINACPKCGSVEVPYPFSTDGNCGDPRYKIYCNNTTNTLEFPSAEGFHYKILSINTSTNKLIINPPTLQETTSCYSSDFPLQGLRLDDRSPFNISSHNTVMLLNCSDNLLCSPLNCSSSSLCRQFEDQMEEGSGCRGRGFKAIAREDEGQTRTDTEKNSRASKTGVAEAVSSATVFGE
ncbi:Wall-associated receptor kinase-like 20 [Morus notabilis]|uniref:Wall-associated receptor kinase-like 20 n=1 Tax=Morus notabilis TaxID=981085 RepID=W9SE95_9ROSA|nr:Wall-associated receptor kinase-like 20 [Morus notabilis]